MPPKSERAQSKRGHQGPGSLCFAQVGIVSFGIGCGKAESPGVYTDVRQYRAWIAETILVRPDWQRCIQ